jgi:hypothetical protein
MRGASLDPVFGFLFSVKGTIKVKDPLAEAEKRKQ